MAARKEAGLAKAQTVKTPSPMLGEVGVAETAVSVTVKKPHARRWRAGLCFTQQPRFELVTMEVLDQLQADPLLVVERQSKIDVDCETNAPTTAG